MAIRAAVIPAIELAWAMKLDPGSP
jgi:hypothetical protein